MRFSGSPRRCTSALSILLVLVVSLVAPSVASAISLDRARELFPDSFPIPGTSAPEGIDDAAGTRSSIVVRQGAYSVSLNGQPLRDGHGVGIDPTPTLRSRETVFGTALIPDGPADWGLTAIPASGANAAPIVVGDSAMRALQAQLLGFTVRQTKVLEGGAYYNDAGGLSRLIVARPQGIEDYVIIPRAGMIDSLVYRLSIPRGASIQQAGATGYVVLDTSGGMIARFDAPEALDASGASIELDVDVDARRRIMTISWPTTLKASAFPIEVDPWFSRTDDYPGSPPQDYQAVFCGRFSNDSGDVSTGEPGAYLIPHDFDRSQKDVPYCADGHMDDVFPLLNLRSDANRFAFAADDNRGIEISVNADASRFRRGLHTGYVEIVPPDGAGIVDSYFRGHIYDTSGAITCEVTYSYNVPNRLLSTPIPRRPGNLVSTIEPDRKLVYAGRPTGGAAAWASFPVDNGYAGLTEVGGNGPAGRGHMAGFFEMVNTPRSLASFKLANEATSIRMSMTVLDASKLSSRSHCNADGIWDATFWDAQVPTINAPSAPQVASNSWYHSDHVKAATDVDVPGANSADLSSSTVFRTFDAADRGSGVRSAFLHFTNPGDPDILELGGQLTCQPSGAGHNSLAPLNNNESQLFTRYGQPCPPRVINTIDKNKSSRLARIAPNSARYVDDPPTPGRVFTSFSSVYREGVHSVTWNVLDYVVNRAESAPMTYRIDDTAPTCWDVASTPNLGRGWYDISFRAQDPNFGTVGSSGLASVAVFVNGQPVLLPNGLYSMSLPAAGVGNGAAPFTLSHVLIPGIDSNPTVQIVVNDRVVATSDGLSKPNSVTCDAEPMRVVRGAGGVAGIMTASMPTVVRTVWSGVDVTAGGAPVSCGAGSGVGRTNTDLCIAPPGHLVTVTMSGYSASGILVYSASGSETVDQTPALTVSDSLDPDGPQSPRYDALNRTPYASNQARSRDLFAQLDDADANLEQGSNPEPKLAGLVQRPAPDVAAGDLARVVFNVRDPRPNITDAAMDASIRVIVDRTQAGDVRARLVDATMAGVAVETAAADQGAWCTTAPGGPGSAVTTYWQLDCSKLVATATAIAPGGVRSVLVQVPLRPRDLDHDPTEPENPVEPAPGATRFPTPDQTYPVTVWARDQRQPADNRYLSISTGAAGIDGTMVDAGGSTATSTVASGDLTLDRILPNANASIGDVPLEDGATVGADGGAVIVTVDGSDRSPTTGSSTTSATTPTGEVASGFGDLALTIRTDGTLTQSLSCGGGDSCRLPLPLESGYHVYTLTLTVHDKAGNVRSATWIVDTPFQFNIVRGATGNVALWPVPPAGVTVTWSCTNLASGVTTSGSAIASADSHLQRSELCAGSPGDPTEFTLSVSNGSRSQMVTRSLAVDHTPDISEGTDQDGPDVRYDSLNGPVYANGTTSRDVTVEISDNDASELNFGNYPLLATTNVPGHPNPIPAHGNVALSIVEIAPHDATRPDAPTAWVITQHNNAASQLRGVVLLEGPQTIDAALSDYNNLGAPQQRCDLQATRVGNGTGPIWTLTDTMITGHYWQLDCSRMYDSYIEAGDGTSVKMTLPIHPTDSGSQGTPNFATPDQQYDVYGWVRDRRQVADGQYLNSGDGVNEAYVRAHAVPLGSIILDRIVPSAGMFEGPQHVRPDAQFSMNDQNLHDMLPTSTSTPTSFDASGLERASASITNDAGIVIGAASVHCTGTLPLDADTTTSCAISASAPHDPGLYHVLVTAYDRAGNHAETRGDLIVDPPMSPPEISLVRGAGGVLAVWPTDPAVDHYEYVCQTALNSTSLSAPVASAQWNAAVLAETVNGVTHQRTPLCNATPGAYVRIDVRAIDSRGNIVVSNGIERVDQQPTIAVDPADPEGGAPRYDAFNRPIYGSTGTTNRFLHVLVADPDAELGLSHDQRPELTGATGYSASVEPDSRGARIVVEVAPPLGRPLAPRAQIEIQLPAHAGDPTFVRLSEGAPGVEPSASPSMNALAVGACQPGQSGQRLTGTYWTIDCADLAIDVKADHANAQLTLPIVPIDLSSATTPDQQYQVTGWVRDPRQAADWDFLPSSASAAVGEPYNSTRQPDRTPLGDLTLDRVLPAASKPTIRSARVGAQRIFINEAVDVTAPNIHDVLPSATGGTFDATGADHATLTVRDTNQHIVGVYAISCSGLPASQDDAATCPMTLTAPATAGRYEAFVTVYDNAGNHADSPVTGFDVVIPEPTGIETFVGAAGSLASWNEPANGVASQWMLVGGGSNNCPLRVRRNANGPSPAASRHLYTDLCKADPNVGLTFEVFNVDAAGQESTHITVSTAVDARPFVAPTTDEHIQNADTTPTPVRVVAADGGADYRRPVATDPVELPSTSIHDRSDIDDNNARMVLRITPAPRIAGTPDATAYLVAEFGHTKDANNQPLPSAQIEPDRLWLVEGSLNDAMTSALPSSGTNVCVEGSGNAIDGSYWHVDCSAANLLNVTGAGTPSAQAILNIAISAKANAPDMRYALAAASRDQRSEDNRFLWNENGIASADALDASELSHSGASSDTPVQWINQGTLLVDRTAPAMTTPSANVNNGATTTLTLRAVVNDVAPANTQDASGVRSVRYEVRALIGGVPSTALAAAGSMTCTPSLPTSGLASATCSGATGALTFTGPGQAQITVTDVAGNIRVESVNFTIVGTGPSSRAGQRDQTFGNDGNGFAVTDVGSNVVQASDSVLAPISGRILTVGTRTDADNNRSIVITAHDPNGQPVAAFGTNGQATYRYQANSKGEAAAADTLGRIYVAGGVNQSQFFTARLGVTRFNADGSLDTSWGAGGTATLQSGGNFSAYTFVAHDIVIDPQGRVLVAATAGNGSAHMEVARFTAQGAVDTTFGLNGLTEIMPPGQFQSNGYALAQLPDGRIIVGGDSYNADSPTLTIARLNSDGSLDTTYGSAGVLRSLIGGVPATIRKIQLQSDSSALVALWAAGGDGVGVGKVTPDGAVDATFGAAAGATYLRVQNDLTRDFDMVTTPDGITVAVAQSGTNNNSPDMIALGAFNPDGTADATFGTNGVVDTAWPGGKAAPSSIILLPDTRAIISGTGTVTATNAQRFLEAAYFTQ